MARIKMKKNSHLDSRGFKKRIGSKQNKIVFTGGKSKKKGEQPRDEKGRWE
jgi:hypothetical protein